MRRDLRRTWAAVAILAIGAATACKKAPASGATSGGGDAGAAGTSAAPAPALGAFEGDIAMRATEAGGTPTDLRFAVKGGKIRVDVAARGQPLHLVYDPAGEHTLVCLDAQKMFIDVPPPSFSAHPGGATDAPQVTRTGRHETIAGTDCEDWEIAEKNGDHASACVAQGVAFFDFHANPMAPPSPQSGWIDALRSQGAFPLRVVTTDRTGRERARMEVTSLEKKTLDASLFAVPPDYRPLTIPHLGGAPGRPMR
jgi:hypothetical protein